MTQTHSPLNPLPLPKIYESQISYKMKVVPATHCLLHAISFPPWILRFTIYSGAGRALFLPGDSPLNSWGVAAGWSPQTAQVSNHHAWTHLPARWACLILKERTLVPMETSLLPPSPGETWESYRPHPKSTQAIPEHNIQILGLLSSLRRSQ